MSLNATGLPSWVWPVLVGPFVGSLLGVLVRRLPEGRPVTMARSACESCGRVLGPLELVPIVSFVALRGRCAGCGAPIAPAHLAIELAATVLAVAAVAAGVRGDMLWADCAFGWVLLALGWIDWQHFRLPDVLTLPLLLAGLAVTAWLQPDELTQNALAAASFYLALRLVAVAYRAARGRSGLGEGDAKLLAAIGAWQGLLDGSHTLLLGAALGLAFGLLRLANGRAGVTTRIPFGPFLAVAAFVIQACFRH
jgi:leader peptidase (prepilin peptidase)/N-methyltransferase